MADQPSPGVPNDVFVYMPNSKFCELPNRVVELPSVFMTGAAPEKRPSLPEDKIRGHEGSPSLLPSSPRIGVPSVTAKTEGDPERGVYESHLP